MGRLFLHILFFLFLHILCGLSGHVFAQNFNFVSYTVEDGLSQSQHKAVFQDSRGLLWFGSYEGGVSSYDGYTFEIYNQRRGLTNDKVQCFEEDQNGNIWVGTYAGVSIIEGDSIRDFAKEELGAKSIYRLSKHQNGAMWIATTKDGFYIYQNQKLHKLNELLDHSFELAFDVTFANDTAYLVADRKLYSIAIDEYGMPVSGARLWDHKALDGQLFSVLYNQGVLWIAKNNGLTTFDGEKLESVSRFDSADVRALAARREGGVWVGTYGNGAVLVQDRSMQQFTTDNGLINNRVHGIVEDNTGAAWMATFGGISCLSSFRFYHIREEHGLQSNFIWNIKEDQSGRLWVAHNEGLSYMKDKQFKHFGEEDGLAAKRTWALATDQHNGVWVGGENGLYLFRNEKLQKIKHHFDNENELVYTIWLDSKGYLWTGGDNGINILDTQVPERSSAFRFQSELPNQAVNTIFEDSRNNIWIGMEAGGLFHLNSARQKLTKVEGLSEIGADIINEVREDNEGYIWVGTSLSGLYVIPPYYKVETPTHIQNYGQDAGLLSENIYAIQVDKQGYLWIGTERGIQRLNIKGGKITDSKTYAKREGFSGLEVNHKAVSLSKDGNIWWGTINGITHHSPYEQKHYSFPPPIYISSIDLFFRKIEVKANHKLHPWTDLPEKLKLPSRQNHLTFHYKAIEVANNHELRYQYKIEGLHEEWLPETKNTEAVYSAISPGSYIFKVRAFRDGQPDLFSEAHYSFTIMYPVWQRWWFITLCLFCAAVLIIVYIRLRIRQLRVQRIALTRKVKERTREIEFQKHEIEEQKAEIETQRDQLEDKSNMLEDLVNQLNIKNNQITDSINYAKKIQETIFPDNQSLEAYFSEVFVLYKPKDIVSGDFYWFNEVNGKAYLAVVDCTGHGVPGAFMSIIGNALLNQAIIEKGLEQADEILRSLHLGVRQILKQFEEDTNLQDGMDIALIVIDKALKKISFAGAKRPVYSYRQGQVKEYCGDRHSIGGYQKEYTGNYSQQELEWDEKTTYFLFTDGYPDQFGGPKNKKYMLRSFRESLKKASETSLHDAYALLLNQLNNWQRKQAQTDDILVLGFRLPKS